MDDGLKRRKLCGDVSRPQSSYCFGEGFLPGGARPASRSGSGVHVSVGLCFTASFRSELCSAGFGGPG